MNENSMFDADHIGHLKCKMTALCANKGVDDWWDVTLKGKEVGKIHLSSNWIPHDLVLAGSEAAATPVPQQIVTQQKIQTCGKCMKIISKIEPNPWS
jgi:hypothetical protein